MLASESMDRLSSASQRRVRRSADGGRRGLSWAPGLESVRNGRNNDGGLEQECALQGQCGLVVQEPMPPLAHDQLRDDDRDERVWASIEDPTDPRVDRLRDLAVGRWEDLELKVGSSLVPPLADRR